MSWLQISIRIVCAHALDSFQAFWHYHMHNDHDIGSFDAPCSDYDTPTPFYMISFFSCADRYFFLQ